MAQILDWEIPKPRREKHDLALYGHPKAGKIWENDCTSRVKQCGWIELGESWPNVCWQPKIMAFLVVYVEDFKLAAKSEHQQRLWDKLKAVIDMWRA